MQRDVPEHYLDSPLASPLSNPVSDQAPTLLDVIYGDDPSEIPEYPNIANPQPQRQRNYHERRTYHPPYTEAVQGSQDNNDDVASHLISYWTDAPPAYSVVVNHLFGVPQISHLPADHTMLIDMNEEAGSVRRRRDVRYSVGQIVKMFIMAFGLLMVSGFLLPTVILWDSV